MNVPRCETCRHWETLAYGELDYRLNERGEQEPTFSEAAPGVLEAAAKPWGTCNRVSEVEFATRSHLFFVVDASEYQANLNTRADFGCVEHET